MNAPWSTEGRNFMSNEGLVAICWQGILKYSVYQEDPHIELCASPVMPCLFMLPESTTRGRPWFHLPTNGLRPAPANQATQIVSPFASILTITAAQFGPIRTVQFINLIYIKLGTFSVEHNLGCYLNPCPLGGSFFYSSTCIFYSLS